MHCRSEGVTGPGGGVAELGAFYGEVLVHDPHVGRDLAEGWIADVGIDVFHPENPHDGPEGKPVLEPPGTVVTSHRAFLSEDAEASSQRRVAELVRDRLAHRVPTVGLLAEEAART
ncbi:hypothetical protein ACH4A8_23060 [Streptomyces vietnamensis]|uniref:hypothetical protein n=1 Tax=Streptomyces vietnamensis TaxID=362257 RepID=UPI0037BADDF1